MFLKELQEYVESHLQVSMFDLSEAELIFSESIQPCELDDFINKNRQPTFSKLLFEFIDQTGNTDSHFYKKAGLDRRHFSKIRSNPDYKIGKNTAIALALALELTKKETEKLLNSAGYSLSDNETFDLVITFCLEKKVYNLNEVNLALDHYHLKPIGRVLE